MPNETPKISNETKKISNETIALYVGISIFALLFIAMCIWNVALYIVRVDPEVCNPPNADYIVELNKSGFISNSCGLENKSPCSFSNVNTLKDAINICDSIPDVCKNFTFNEISSTMNILNITGSGDLTVYSKL